MGKDGGEEGEGGVEGMVVGGEEECDLTVRGEGCCVWLVWDGGLRWKESSDEGDGMG